MGIFDGIGDAELFERGKFLVGNFRGLLEVKRTIAKETRNSGTGFIVEFEVHETNNPAEHAKGSKCTWFQKMGVDGAQSSVKAWAAAVCGFASHEKDRIEKELSPHLAQTLEHATDNPADNDLTGQFVRVETMMVVTKKGNDFTRHDWSPYDETEEEPTDAVDEVKE